MNENYETSDQHIASYLLMLVEENKLRLETKRKEPSGRVVLGFSPFDVANEASREFEYGIASKPLKRYVESLKAFRSILFSMKYDNTNQTTY